MKKGQLCITLFWIALGLFVSVYSFRLGLGKLLNPGPGLMPFLLGVIILLVALYKLIREHGRDESREADTPRLSVDTPRLAVKARKPALIVAVLLAYALSLETLGYIVTTLVAMALLLRITGYRRWTLLVSYPVIIVGASYLLFSYLGVRFPPGVLGSLGMR